MAHVAADRSCGIMRRRHTTCRGTRIVAALVLMAGHLPLALPFSVVASIGSSSTITSSRPLLPSNLCPPSRAAPASSLQQGDDWRDIARRTSRERWQGKSATALRAASGPGGGSMELGGGEGDAEYRKAGPDTPKPAYDDSSLFDRTAIGVFRQGMASNLGSDVPEEGFAGLMKLALMLNRRFSPEETQQRTRRILVSLFPPFILKLFPIMFSSPFPAFSAKLNALITSSTCKWLMGPQSLFDLDQAEMAPGWGDGKGQGILIERCRYLEESGCASVCINSCKVPTQEFFARDMGIPLSMEPDYDTFECRFKFGVVPQPQGTDPVFSSPCFSMCPSKSRGRHHSSEQDCATLLPGVGTLYAVRRYTDVVWRALDSGYDSSVPDAREFRGRLSEWIKGEGS